VFLVAGIVSHVITITMLMVERVDVTTTYSDMHYIYRTHTTRVVLEEKGHDSTSTIIPMTNTPSTLHYGTPLTTVLNCQSW
jgi:hypothetical protein